MSHGLGSNLRQRVLTAISAGSSTRQAAARFGVGVSTAGDRLALIRPAQAVATVGANSRVVLVARGALSLVEQA